MKKIKIIVQYDGTDFHGFQSQMNLRTIQGTLEKSLSKVIGENITIFGSGRTDAGVHALGQVCHFITESQIPVEKYPYVFNMTLPKDLLILSASIADSEFDARKSAFWKKYRYQIDTNRVPNLFSRRFRTHVPQPMDVERMREATKCIIGTHDFTSFCSAKTPIKDKVRTIYQIEIYQDLDGMIIDITGNGFLYNMVRIIVGTLVNIGIGKMEGKAIPDILLAKDRTMGGPTMPPEGLILMEVGYEPWGKQ